MESENAKQYYIMCWKRPTRYVMHASTLFLMLNANRECFWSRVWIAQASVLFQLFWCVRVVFVHVLLETSPKTSIWWWYIRGPGGPQISINNATTTELAQRPYCWIICVLLSPILLKPAILLVSFQEWNEIHKQFLVTSRRYLFTEENGSNYPPSRDSTPYSDF